MRQFFRTVALCAVAVLCGCKDQGRSARDAAEEMSRHFAEQRFTEAYEQASSAFRFTRSINYFEARVRDLGLCDARGVAWNEPERHGRLAGVRGVFTLKDGGKLPLKFTFTLEEGGWRLIEARSDSGNGGVGSEDIFAVAARSRDTMTARSMDILEPNALDVPAEPQLRQLAEDTLLLFNEAIQNGGDFSALYASASDRWKYRGRDPLELSSGGGTSARATGNDPFNEENRLTAAALRNAFGAAVEAKVDLSPIKGKKLLLTEPARVNSDGVLNVSGTFDAIVSQGSMPGSPRKVEFALEYVREASRWKLFGLTVHVVAAGNSAAR